MIFMGLAGCKNGGLRYCCGGLRGVKMSEDHVGETLFHGYDLGWVSISGLKACDLKEHV